jgi:hypothetical protein
MKSPELTMQVQRIKRDLYGIRVSFTFVVYCILTILLTIVRYLWLERVGFFQAWPDLNTQWTFVHFYLFNQDINTIKQLLDIVLIITIIGTVLHLFVGGIFVILKFLYYLLIALFLFYPFAWFKVKLNISAFSIIFELNLWLPMLLLITTALINASFDFLMYFAEDYKPRFIKPKDESEPKYHFFLTLVGILSMWTTILVALILNPIMYWLIFAGIGLTFAFVSLYQQYTEKSTKK